MYLADIVRKLGERCMKKKGTLKKEICRFGLNQTAKNVSIKRKLWQ